MALAAGVRCGPYEITEKIGAGGMGEVYRARDTKLDRDVALKILPEAFAADADRVMRFEREARTLAALNHPHIAQVYGLEDAPEGSVGSLRALVMELVEGEDLAARLARGAIPIEETRRARSRRPRCRPACLRFCRVPARAPCMPPCRGSHPCLSGLPRRSLGEGGPAK